jgi:galactose mutarotase-like enzyme
MVPVTATPQDFTRPRQIGSTQLDTAYGSLVRGDDGRAVARLHDLDSGRSLHLWVDGSYRYLMVYTADQVARPERRRAAMAIEPVTCLPDASRTGADLIELEPGESSSWNRGSLGRGFGGWEAISPDHVRGSYRLAHLPAGQAQRVSDHRTTL